MSNIMKKSIVVSALVIWSFKISFGQNVPVLNISQNFRIYSYKSEKAIEGVINLENNVLTFVENGQLFELDIITKNRRFIRELVKNEEPNDIIESLRESKIRTINNQVLLQSKYSKEKYCKIDYGRLEVCLSPNLNKVIYRSNNDPRIYLVGDSSGNILNSFHFNPKDYPTGIIDFFSDNRILITENTGYRTYNSEPIGYHLHILNIDDYKISKIGPFPSIIKYLTFLHNSKIGITERGFVLDINRGEVIGKLNSKASISNSRDNASIPIVQTEGGTNLIAIMESDFNIQLYKLPNNFFLGNKIGSTNSTSSKKNSLEIHYIEMDRKEFLKAKGLVEGKRMVKIVYLRPKGTRYTIRRFIEFSEVGNRLSMSSGYGEKLFSEINSDICFGDTCILNAQWYREGVLNDGDLFVTNSGFKSFKIKLIEELNTASGKLLSCEYMGGNSDDLAKIERESQLKKKLNGISSDMNVIHSENAVVTVKESAYLGITDESNSCNPSEGSNYTSRIYNKKGKLLYEYTNKSCTVCTGRGNKEDNYMRTSLYDYPITVEVTYKVCSSITSSFTDGKLVNAKVMISKPCTIIILPKK